MTKYSAKLKDVHAPRIALFYAKKVDGNTKIFNHNSHAWKCVQRRNFKLCGNLLLGAIIFS